MNFRDATDELCSKLGHEDVAQALGVSIQAVRQARMEQETAAHRKPPEDWRSAIISLAEQRVWQYRKLIEQLCRGG